MRKQLTTAMIEKLSAPAKERIEIFDAIVERLRSAKIAEGVVERASGISRWKISQEHRTRRSAPPCALAARTQRAR
jgi:hypothetical protein